ncbi:MAG: ATP-binding protein [Aggregatilineales bacterium]
MQTEDISHPVDHISLLARLHAAHNFMLRLGTNLDADQIMHELPRVVIEITGVERAALLTIDAEESSARLAGIYGLKAPEDITQLSSDAVYFPLQHADDPFIRAWQQNALAGVPEPIHSVRGTVLAPLAAALQSGSFCTAPLNLGDLQLGVLFVDNPETGQPLDENQQTLLRAICPGAVITLNNALVHSHAVKELAARMYELHLLRQIDRELTDTIQLDHVFELTIDWALRFTKAHAASLALCDDTAEQLRFVAEIGYEAPPEQREAIRMSSGGGIAGRVARSGHAELVPDVSIDRDYAPISSQIRSHLSVPVMREDRVIAVISVESRHLNGLTHEHQDFVEKLAMRAGVAIDNARLFSETLRQREKLSYVLANIADVVIVINTDDTVELINQSALAALQLPPGKVYRNQPFLAIIDYPPLREAYLRAQGQNSMMVVELMLPNGRTYYANFAMHPQIGWLIVMHDITPLKETDQLKTELVSTVSHDLKQPLTVMNGYLEMLQMHQPLEPRAENYVRMIFRSIQNMRELIDDVLNLARIESGIKLDLRPVKLSTVIADCLENMRQIMADKAMLVYNEVTPNFPPVFGDPRGISQIFANLISNAIKYTPPEGTIRLWAEARGDSLQVAIEDTGLGISPEDQARIFDRFYRVRRAETDSIEGTGLGLAIVKRLVEAHNGQIGLESRLGKGTTFFVTLPLASNNS